MPILKDVRETKTVELPSFENSKVVLYKTLLTGQVKELENSKDEMERGIKTLILLIKEWNFTNEKNEPLPINEESINMLPIKDLRFLIIKILSFFD